MEKWIKSELEEINEVNKISSKLDILQTVKNHKNLGDYFQNIFKSLHMQVFEVEHFGKNEKIVTYYTEDRLYIFSNFAPGSKPSKFEDKLTEIKKKTGLSFGYSFCYITNYHFNYIFFKESPF
jgi:Rad3-related DNA helicase